MDWVYLRLYYLSKKVKFIILIYHSSFSLYALTSLILLWGYKEILLYFFLKVLKLCFSHVSMVHLEFNFVYEVRYGYNFIFFHIKKQLSRFNNWSVCPFTRDVQLYKNSHSFPICKSLFWGVLYCILLVLNIHRLLDFHINCIFFSHKNFRISLFRSWENLWEFLLKLCRINRLIWGEWLLNNSFSVFLSTNMKLLPF